jgi:tRNA (uracil-5-)-methyltransferase TRM9
VYEKIAEEFSSTRYKIWPSVSGMIEENIRFGSNILEIGFGNGKNLDFIAKKFANLRPAIFGIDTCEKFLKMVKKKFLPKTRPNGQGCDERLIFGLYQADQRNLPFESECMDMVLSIAVLHHLDTKEKRKVAVQEMWRVLKPGGSMMIQVWAKEQPSNSKRKFDTQEEMVSWRNKGYRYYHVFIEGELEDLIRTSVGFDQSTDPDMFELKISYECGNWAAVVKKK